MINCDWLPNLEICEDFNNWSKYENRIYDIFKNDFITTHPQFNSKNVKVRFHPRIDDKEQAFYHLTTKDYTGDEERLPDVDRCARIRWVRKFIENYSCNNPVCLHCNGVLSWETVNGNRKRIKIFLEEEHYIVIVEIRDTFCLLITAFYVNYEHSLRKIKKEYEKAKSAS